MPVDPIEAEAMIKQIYAEVRAEVLGLEIGFADNQIRLRGTYSRDVRAAQFRELFETRDPFVGPPFGVVNNPFPGGGANDSLHEILLVHLPAHQAGGSYGQVGACAAVQRR